MSAQHVGAHIFKLEIVGIEVAQPSNDRLCIVYVELRIECVCLALLLELLHILEHCDACDAGR